MTENVLKRVVLLAARTSRSNSYIQAMANARFKLQKVIIFGDNTQPRPGQLEQAPEPTNLDGLFTPDLSLPLHSGCIQISNDVEELPCRSVNDPRLFGILQDLAPDLVIYSGYGGEIVSPELCKAFRLLHMHSGFLPQFRGSTTLYYSWLLTGSCGVSGILMAPEIDAGPVVARKYYSSPPPGSDVDHLYDGAIRSDLLIDVLKYYSKVFELSTPKIQSNEEERTYYVIHPVLKNIALRKHF